jgi:anti-anti-sigma factor
VNNYVIGKGVHLVYLKGTVNAQSESTFSDSYRQALADNTHTIIFNFSGVTSINLFGINILVRLYLQSRQHGIAVAAVGLSDKYRQIFRAIGLNEGITVYDDEFEAFAQAGIPDEETLYWNDRVYLANLYAPPGDGRMLDSANWAIPGAAPPNSRNIPPMILNTFRHHGVSGPLQGFGQLWEKTCLMPLGKSRLQPAGIIETLKKQFAVFSSPDTIITLPDGGITPGEIMGIKISYRYGRLLTGALVLHCDEHSFTLITPAGHPKSGWVTFCAYRDGGNTFVQAQGLSRTSDPSFALAFHPLISHRDEYTWRHIMENLSRHYHIDAAASVQRTCWDTGWQWSGLLNIRHNAQLRSIPYNLNGMLRRVLGRTTSTDSNR